MKELMVLARLMDISRTQERRLRFESVHPIYAIDIGSAEWIGDLDSGVVLAVS